MVINETMSIAVAKRHSQFSAGRRAVVALISALAAFNSLAATSEISVDLKLDHNDFVLGERVRGVVDIVNVSPDTIAVGYPGSEDRFSIEVYRAQDGGQLEKISKGAFVAEFLLKPNEGQKLEAFLADHYGLAHLGRYHVKPVLVHDGIRYEGQTRAFDIVPGMKAGSALQIFANRDGLKREFELMTWSRKGTEHLFLGAKDIGASERRWRTIDLGALMKITKPSVSILTNGEVIVLHRFDSDNFVRSELWSVPQGIEFIQHELVRDPETAGSARVRELYQESGGVKPPDRSWWEFWK